MQVSSLLTSVQRQASSPQSHHPGAVTNYMSQPMTGSRQGAQGGWISMLDHGLPWGVTSYFPTLTSPQGSNKIVYTVNFG